MLNKKNQESVVCLVSPRPKSTSMSTSPTPVDVASPSHRTRLLSSFPATGYETQGPLLCFSHSQLGLRIDLNRPLLYRQEGPRIPERTF